MEPGRACEAVVATGAGGAEVVPLVVTVGSSVPEDLEDEDLEDIDMASSLLSSSKSIHG